jgi:hypothetical protein
MEVLPLELSEIILAVGPKEEKKAAFLRKMKDGREEKRIYAHAYLATGLSRRTQLHGLTAGWIVFSRTCFLVEKDTPNKIAPEAAPACQIALNRLRRGRVILASTKIRTTARFR